MTAGIGHNSGAHQPVPAADLDTNAARDALKAYIERVERVEEEISERRADVKEIYAEAKATGYDVKALRKIVQIRKQDRDKRKELESMVELYCQALGMESFLL